MFSVLHSAIIHICLVIQIIRTFCFQDVSQTIFGAELHHVSRFVAMSLLTFAMLMVLCIFSAGLNCSN